MPVPAYPSPATSPTLVALVALLLFGLTVQPAVASLLITPKRVVLDDRRDQALFNVMNTSRETRTYELSWRQMRMEEGGRLVEVKEPRAPGNASSLVIVSPTRVRLSPGERQTVRLRSRLPGGLPEGEYMSHLTFHPVPEAQPPAASAGDGMRLALDVNLSFSVPVIVRHGALQATAAIRPTHIDVAAGRLTVGLERSGARGVFGDLEVYWGQPGGTGVQVGRVNSVAAYANVRRVETRVPLTPPQGVRIGPGLLKVIYRDPVSGEVIAESTVQLQ